MTLNTRLFISLWTVCLPLSRRGTPHPPPLPFPRVKSWDLGERTALPTALRFHDASSGHVFSRAEGNRPTRPRICSGRRASFTSLPPSRVNGSLHFRIGGETTAFHHSGGEQRPSLLHLPLRVTLVFLYSSSPYFPPFTYLSFPSPPARSPFAFSLSRGSPLPSAATPRTSLRHGFSLL